MFTAMLAFILVAGLYQLARRGQKPAGKKGAASKKDSSSSGSWFNSVGNVSKSTATTYGEYKKIDLRFKDVAGHDNAK